MVATQVGNRLPEEYFPEVEQRHPGALASQWIPQEPHLWKLENYRGFLEARKNLLAEAANNFLEQLLHGDRRWLEGPAAVPVAAESVPATVGSIESPEEEEQLEQLNKWVVEQGLPRGQIAHEIADPRTGQQEAILDLAWPQGLQEGLSQPIAVLLNEDKQVLALASERGYRCFTDPEHFKRYVLQEVLSEEAVA